MGRRSYTHLNFGILWTPVGICVRVVCLSYNPRGANRVALCGLVAAQQQEGVGGGGGGRGDLTERGSEPTTPGSPLAGMASALSLAGKGGGGLGGLGKSYAHEGFCEGEPG